MALLVIAAILTAASGAYLRYELLTPATGNLQMYSHLLSLHLIWAYFGLCLPLPFAVYHVALSLRFAALQRDGQVGAATEAGRAANGLQAAALALNGAGLIASIVPLAPGVEGLRFAEAAVLLFVLASFADAVSALVAIRGRALGAARFFAVPLVLSLLATVVWGVPCVVGVVRSLVTHDNNALAAASDAFVSAGIYVILVPACVVLIGIFSAASPLLFPPLQRRLRRMMLLIAVFITVSLSGAGLALLLAAAGSIDSYLNDSYFFVGAAHAFFGAPAWVFLLWWALPSLPSRGLGWLIFASAVAFVVACLADVMVGLHGMPRQYAHYPSEFMMEHWSAAIAWGVVCSLLVVTASVAARSRRQLPASDVF